MDERCAQPGSTAPARSPVAALPAGRRRRRPPSLLPVAVMVEAKKKLDPTKNRTWWKQILKLFPVKKYGGSKTICWIQLLVMHVLAVGWLAAASLRLRLAAGSSAKQQKIWKQQKSSSKKLRRGSKSGGRLKQNQKTLLAKTNLGPSKNDMSI